MRVKVLDHGYLEFIEGWGSDERIVEAARMSTGKGFLGWGLTEGICVSCGWTTRDLAVTQCINCSASATVYQKTTAGDEKLLRYLYEHKHSTPFEMAGMVIEVQAPIFVFREWHRHRTQSYNEMSARYTPLPNVNYVPTVERLMMNSKINKQAGTVKDSEELTQAAAELYQQDLINEWFAQQYLYQKALRIGVPKELARVHLGVGRYSRMRAQSNLRNLLAFLTLRMAPEAQWEIRQYANEVGKLIADKFPRTWELFLGK